MDYQRFSELYEEFSEFLYSLHTLYLDSLAGYSLLHVATLKEEKEIQQYPDINIDDYNIPYENICEYDFFAFNSASSAMKLSDVKKRTSQNGINSILVGRMCVVLAYTYWDEYFRKEVAYAMGVLSPDQKNQEEVNQILNEHVSEDFWGDVRHLRTSIVHKNGIAVSDISKCKLLNWFSCGESIDLDYEKMRVVFNRMAAYRNQLLKQSFPPTFIKVGKR